MLSKGFRQLLIKTGIFLLLFVIISFIIGQGIVASSLLYDFYLFVYGGMGKVLLFCILGFVLFYRDRLLKLEEFAWEKLNFIYLVISFVCVVVFYLLELNVDSLSVGFLSIVFVHLLFLSIFVFLVLGVFGRRFILDFFKNFRRELFYFLIFGIIVYSLMFFVWKLWSYFSLVVLRANSFLLGFFGDVFLIDEFTLSFNGFAAEIGEACSGIYSIFIFVAIFLFAVILDWEKFNKKKVCLIFVPAVVGAFCVNIFRVFLLFVVGFFVSREIAVGLYHSYTGMIFFLIYFAVFWKVSYRWMRK